jgi:hypothetical protein
MINDAIVGIASALAGGSAVKLIDKFVKSKDKEIDSEDTFWKEVMEEAQKLRAELSAARDSNFKLQQEHVTLKTEHGVIVAKCTSLEATIVNLKAEIRVLKKILYNANKDAPGSVPGTFPLEESEDL